MYDVKEISKQPIMEWKGQTVITTAQLAEVYGTTAKNVTHNFSRNKDRFEEGKHFFALQGKELKEFMRVVPESNLPQSTSIAYLWTRRGASRHCKILGTDKAWEQFDYLEENYFDRQGAAAPQLPTDPMKLLELHYQALKQVDGKVSALSNDLCTVRKDLEDFKNDMPILGIEESKITSAVKRKGVQCLGGKESNAYQDRSLRGKLYADLYGQLYRNFGVKSYLAIKRNQTETAITIIQGYTPPLVLAETIETVNAQLMFSNMEDQDTL
jgi:ORF6N domain./ORF6C domain.